MLAKAIRCNRFIKHRLRLSLTIRRQIDHMLIYAVVCYALPSLNERKICWLQFKSFIKITANARLAFRIVPDEK